MALKQWLQRGGHWIKQAMPGYCAFCLAPALAGQGWCATCLDELPWNRHACRQCGDPVTHGASLCGHCLINPPLFSTTRAGLLYQGAIKQLVHDFKFQASPRAGMLLAELMLLTPPMALGDALLSVPMTPIHARTRGFNQSYWLAEQLSRQLGIQMLSAKRIKNSPSQRTLNRRQRAANLSGAFVFESPPPAHLLIIDDVTSDT
ncbi:ComF family protein [Halomonas sp. AOP13-D3-9]